MVQNAISGKLKLKIFLGEHISRLPAFGNYWILNLYDSVQDPFSPPSSECLQMPLISTRPKVAGLQFVTNLYIANQSL